MLMRKAFSSYGPLYPEICYSKYMKVHCEKVGYNLVQTGAQIVGTAVGGQQAL